MFLNIKISKATPDRAIKYATSKNILEETKTRNLFSSKSPADEMKSTALRFGKWQSPKDRKSFSIVISPNPKDNPSKEQLLEITEAVLDHFFPTIQGIIVLHKDRGKDSKKTSPVLHAHFYGSIINPETGKNIHLSDTDVRRIRAWADEYAKQKYNWMPFGKGTQSKEKAYKKSLMDKINNRGQVGWLSKLKSSVIKAYDKASSFMEFCSLLSEEGISVLRETETNELKFEISVKGKQYEVNAITLSENFTWDKLQDKFMKTANRRNEYDRNQRNTHQKEAHLGAGNTSSSVRTGAGKNGGQGPLGKHKVNYACIFCTKDKDICRKCTEFKYREREGHGYRSR